jgi:hypothetical protein
VELGTNSAIRSVDPRFRQVHRQEFLPNQLLGVQLPIDEDQRGMG